MIVDSLSAVVFFSQDPARLAAFYEQYLGIVLRPESHGPMRDHLEGELGDLHMAVLKGRSPDGKGGGVSLTFRVGDLEPFVQRLESEGVSPTRKIIELGEGKRLATYSDPDGNSFSLIEVKA
jgi:predicted enzyme related to lactoylglutathione lyase